MAGKPFPDALVRMNSQENEQVGPGPLANWVCTRILFTFLALRQNNGLVINN